MSTSSKSVTNDAVQVIDEEKVFQQQAIKDYVKDVIKVDLGLHYHVISVFGSQSTGKSTLLNRLFHTNFDVMNETQRQQTTKGIWLGYSSNIASTKAQNENEKILVMDVEGSDGRERGEDQDFERKAALFALSTSEVLIVNIWEHQVGLYQGANMGLLKTVFEVNLSLFGNKDHKVLLLFVIRDHIGTTPLENLSNTLTQDLNRMWSAISKPPSVDPDVQLNDFFDLQFTTLAHKILQPEKFDENVKELGDKFIDSSRSDYIFKKEYRQNFPIDGWTLYAKNCWEQIQSNKDLDLPTQQILVARFRCDEIAKESFELFNQEFKSTFATIELASISGEQLALIFSKLAALALESYDSQAAHYSKPVYEARRETLYADIWTKLKAVYQEFVKELKKSTIEKFKASFTDKTNKGSFLDKSLSARELALTSFTANISPLKEVNGEEFSYEAELEVLSTELEEELTKLREIEITNLVARITKRSAAQVKTQTLELLAHPDELIWDNILSAFQNTLNESLSKFKNKDNDTYDFKLGSSDDVNAEIFTRINKSAWISFDQFIHEYISEDNVVNILRREFEDAFSYDQNNVPRVWKNETEISQAYQVATELALKSLPILSIAKLSNGSEIIPDYPVDDEDEQDEDEPHRFAHILTATQQVKIKKQFLKVAEISYRDANRSIIANIARIPPFIYVLLIVLGWNEFMAILRNPLYLVLTILVGTGLFFVNTLNLWGPLNTAANLLLKEVKEWLAGLLLDEHPQRIPVKAQQEFDEKIELSDLPSKRE